MIRKKVILLIIFLLPLQIYAQGNLSAPEMLDVFQSRAQDAAQVATILFNPVTGTPQKPMPNPYPTTSINETAVDQTFGTAGMNINATFAKYNPSAAQYPIDLVRYIKNFYFYMDYIVKIELAAKIAAYARTQNIDVLTVLDKKSWTDLVNQASQKAGGYNQLKLKVAPLQPNFDDVKLSFAANSWLDIPKTDFWKAVQITHTDILNSSLWQDYAKYIISRTFRQDGLLLPSIFNVEESIFRYLPNFEISYYQDDFTQLRNSSEYFRLHLVLADEIRLHFLKQCNDWQPLIDRVTGEPDLLKTYSQALKFQQEDFCQFLSLTETYSPNHIIDMIINKKIPIDPAFAKKPLVQEKLLCISMIKNLQALTNYLYQTVPLEKTMQTLASTSIQKPNPNFLFYRPDDYIYLEDLANIVDNFKQQAQKLATGEQPHETGIKSVARSQKVKVQGLIDWLSDTWSDVSASKIGKDISSLVQDTVTALGDEAKALGYTIASGVLTAIDPKKSDELLRKSRDLQAKVSAEFDKAMSDATNTVEDVETLAKQGVNELATAIGDVISKIDPETGKAIAGQIASILDFVITFLAGAAEAGIVITNGIVKFSADAVNTMANVVVDVMFKPGDWSQLGQDVLNGVKQLSYDFVTTLLSSVSLVGSTFMEQLTNIVKFLGYGISMITDIFIDVVKGVMSKVSAVLGFFGLTAASNAAEVAGEWLDNHRRLIDTVVTTGLMIGAVILTDGAAAPLLIMTVGPQLFQGIGAEQSDERTIAIKAEQKIFVNNFKTFVDNNETIAEQSQKAWSEELTGKFTAQITNQERELGFYENFLRSYIENMKTQLGIFGTTYIQQQIALLDDRTPATMFGDLGAIYGLKTNVLNLNPSQGFALYNAGRNSFSQEIAEYPALAIATEQDQYITSTTPRVFWFNQKETIQVDTPITEVEIKFKPIYVLNMFYVGLYFGGKSFNFDQIRKDRKLDIDIAHHAKMFVYKKEGKEDSTKLGIYEHEGAGWIPTLIDGPQFVLGKWYRMNIKLNNTTLQVKVWEESKPESASQTITVLPSPEQKTFGVISAGASIEYQIIKPKLPDPVVTADSSGKSMRQKMQTEQQREFETRNYLLEPNLHPKFGSFNLQPLSIMSIIRGKYIYKSKTADPRILIGTDYLVAGCQVRNGTIKIVDIGKAPADPCIKYGQPLDPAVVSLITNKAYNEQNQHITTCQNVYDVYLKQHGPLPDTDFLAIDGARKHYITTQLTPFSFGTLALQTTGSQELINGQYIYWSISPDPALRDKNGPVKDDKGKPIFDYFAMVSNDAIGAPYDPTIQTVRSFVTGNEFTKPQKYDQTGYAPGKMLEQFNNTFGPLRPELINNITAAQQFYKAQGTKSSKTTPNQKTTPNDTATTVAYTGTAPLLSLQTPGGQSQSSIDQQTGDASADQLSFGT